MEYEKLIVALAVLLPAVAAIVVPAVKNEVFRVFAAVGMCGLIILNSYFLFLTGKIYMSANLLSSAVIYVNYILLAYLFFLGVRRKSLPLCFFSFLEVLLFLWFMSERHFAYPNMTVIYSDALSKTMILTVSSLSSMFAVLCTKYGHLSLSTDRRAFLGWTFALNAIVNAVLLINNIVILSAAVNALAAAFYHLTAADRTPRAYNAASSAAVFFVLSSFFILSAACIFYAYNGAEEGMSITNLMRNGTLKSAQKVSTAVVLIYVASFIMSGMPPFHSFVKKISRVNFIVSAVFNICIINVGIYLLLRFAPSYELLSLSGKLTGPLVGLAVTAFGAFSFLSCSVIAFTHKKMQNVSSFVSVGGAGLVAVCCGVCSPLALTAAIFMFVFYSAINFLLFASSIRPRDPVSSWIFRLTLFASFLPPFGMFFSLWFFFVSLLSYTVPSSSLKIASVFMNLSASAAAAMTAIGAAVLLFSKIKQISECEVPDISFKAIKISGVSAAVLTAFCIMSFLSFNIQIVFAAVKPVVAVISPVEAAVPSVVSSLMETDILPPVCSGASAHPVGKYPALQMICLGMGIFVLCAVCLARNKNKLVLLGNKSEVKDISHTWGKMFLGRYAKYISEHAVNAYCYPVSVLLLAFIVGIAAGITFR